MTPIPQNSAIDYRLVGKDHWQVVLSDVQTQQLTHEFTVKVPGKLSADEYSILTKF